MSCPVLSCPGPPLSGAGRAKHRGGPSAHRLHARDPAGRTTMLALTRLTSGSMTWSSDRPWRLCDTALGGVVFVRSNLRAVVDCAHSALPLKCWKSCNTLASARPAGTDGGRCPGPSCRERRCRRRSAARFGLGLIDLKPGRRQCGRALTRFLAVTCRSGRGNRKQKLAAPARGSPVRIALPFEFSPATRTELWIAV